MSQMVLLVEDDSVVRKFIVACLEREDLIVLPACDGAEALEILRTRMKVDLLLTDVQLETGMNGIELAERIIQERPGTKVLVMSGYPDRQIEAAEKRLPFLPKPFTTAILNQAVTEVLGSTIPAQSETNNSSQPRPTSKRSTKPSVSQHWRNA
jgi:CheY-like chemotaxis protein